jgi:ApbE superfamily uncharacterized protein (UPF0280 family)
MNNNELLKKLITIVAKQQKIITKLAQTQQTFINAVTAVLPPGVTVSTARAGGEGALDLRLNKSPSVQGNVGDQIRNSLVGKSIKDDNGGDYQVTSNKYQIQIIFG